MNRLTNDVEVLAGLHERADLTDKVTTKRRVRDGKETVTESAAAL